MLASREGHPTIIFLSGGAHQATSPFARASLTCMAADATAATTSHTTRRRPSLRNLLSGPRFGRSSRRNTRAHTAQPAAVVDISDTAARHRPHLRNRLLKISSQIFK